MVDGKKARLEDASIVLTVYVVVEILWYGTVLIDSDLVRVLGWP
jgi:hypothetical protein